MTTVEPATHDGIVAFWLLTGGAWALESPVTHPQQANCRRALHELLSAALDRGVPQKDSDELMHCLRTDPRGSRALVLASLIASVIPDAVASRVTGDYLQDDTVATTESTAEELALLYRVRRASCFTSQPQ